MKFPFFKKSNGNDLLSECLRGMVGNGIVLERQAVNSEPSIGTSKIGGAPHLPAGFEWPYYEAENYDGEYANRPLSFIAQINLADIAPFDKRQLLPETGYLYFFYEIVTQKWGYDPSDEGCARVYYYDVPAEQLKETPLPKELSEKVCVPLSVISFIARKELPSYEEFCYITNQARFGEGFNWDSYDKAVEKQIKLSEQSPEEVCKLLGYADLIQGPIIDECARVASGLYCGDAEGYRSLSKEQKAEIAADALNWTLLAQFGTLSDDIMFGDCGCIYFYIRKEDLASRRFDRIWLCLQCG